MFLLFDFRWEALFKDLAGEPVPGVPASTRNQAEHEHCQKIHPRKRRHHLLTPFTARIALLIEIVAPPPECASHVEIQKNRSTSWHALPLCDIFQRNIHEVFRLLALVSFTGLRRPVRGGVALLASAFIAHFLKLHPSSAWRARTAVNSVLINEQENIPQCTRVCFHFPLLSGLSLAGCNTIPVSAARTNSASSHDRITGDFLARESLPLTTAIAFANRLSGAMFCPKGLAGLLSPIVFTFTCLASQFNRASSKHCSQLE